MQGNKIRNKLKLAQDKQIEGKNLLVLGSRKRNHKFRVSVPGIVIFNFLLTLNLMHS